MYVSWPLAARKIQPINIIASAGYVEFGHCCVIINCWTQNNVGTMSLHTPDFESAPSFRISSPK